MSALIKPKPTTLEEDSNSRIHHQGKADITVEEVQMAVDFLRVMMSESLSVRGADISLEKWIYANSDMPWLRIVICSRVSQPLLETVALIGNSNGFTITPELLGTIKNLLAEPICVRELREAYMLRYAINPALDRMVRNKKLIWTQVDGMQEQAVKMLDSGALQRSEVGRLVRNYEILFGNYCAYFTQAADKVKLIKERSAQREEPKFIKNPELWHVTMHDTCCPLCRALTDTMSVRAPAVHRVMTILTEMTKPAPTGGVEEAPQPVNTCGIDPSAFDKKCDKSEAELDAEIAALGLSEMPVSSPGMDYMYDNLECENGQ